MADTYLKLYNNNPILDSFLDGVTTFIILSLSRHLPSQ